MRRERPVIQRECFGGTSLLSSRRTPGPSPLAYVMEDGLSHLRKRESAPYEPQRLPGTRRICVARCRLSSPDNHAFIAAQIQRAFHHLSFPVEKRRQQDFAAKTGGF